MQQQQWQSRQAADAARRASERGRDAHRLAQNSARRGSSGRATSLIQLVILIAAVVYLADHPDVRATLWGYAQHAWSHLNALMDDARSGS
ncbi:hypothetical protein [Streptomyces sp. NPDC001415]